MANDNYDNHRQLENAEGKINLYDSQLHIFVITIRLTM